MEYVQLGRGSVKQASPRGKKGKEKGSESSAPAVAGLSKVMAVILYVLYVNVSMYVSMYHGALSWASARASTQIA